MRRRSSKNSTARYSGAMDWSSTRFKHCKSKAPPICKHADNTVEGGALQGDLNGHANSGVLDFPMNTINAMSGAESSLRIYR
jgi:hypothetical protein